MTELQIKDLCDTLSSQAGLDEEAMMKAIGFWRANLLQIDYAKAQEAVKTILFDKRSYRKAGEWFAGIVKYCGGVPSTTADGKQVHEGCQNCQFTGCIEVPHKNDWSNGYWKGQYTMVVACECPMGVVKAAQTMNIRQYEANYPYWRQEHPRRQIEFKMTMLQRTGVVGDELNRRLAVLQRQLDECDREAA